MPIRPRLSAAKRADNSATIDRDSPGGVCRGGVCYASRVLVVSVVARAYTKKVRIVGWRGALGGFTQRRSAAYTGRWRSDSGCRGKRPGDGRGLAPRVGAPPEVEAAG